jgi:hypothetical protein
MGEAATGTNLPFCGDTAPVPRKALLYTVTNTVKPVDTLVHS